MNGSSVRERLSMVRGGAIRAALAGTLLVIVAIAAAGCEITLPKTPERAPPSFAHLPPLVFDLGRIEIVAPSAAPLASDVDHLFPTSPAVAVRLWAEERLRAEGMDGVLRVTIDEASARATPLATNTDIEDLFTREQNERVEVRLRVTIEAIDGAGQVRGSAIADTRRSRTLPEGISLTERERQYDDIVDDLIRDYNASQVAAIRQYLQLYLR